MRPRRLVPVLLCLISLTGCGTVFNVFGPRQYPHAYGGVEFDYLVLQSAWSPAVDDPKLGWWPGTRLLVTSMVAADFPLSLAGDTITLPHVLFWSGVEKSRWYSWTSKDNHNPPPHATEP